MAPSHRTPEDTISKYAANLVADGHAAPSGARQLLDDIVAHPEMRFPRVVRRVDVEPGALSQVTCPLRRSAPRRGSRSADDCSRFDAIRHSIQHLDTAALTPMNTLSLLRRRVSVTEAFPRLHLRDEPSRNPLMPSRSSSFSSGPNQDRPALFFPLAARQASPSTTPHAGGRCCCPDLRWGHSSVGRALEWHSRGQGFDSPWLHQIVKITLAISLR